MKIELNHIKVRDLTENYSNTDEEWVVWYGWKLDIRPKYQREFVYKDKQRDAVMETLRKWFPLNVMYWVVREDWTFEVLDWQQRTISICEYVAWNYSIKDNDWNAKYFQNLTQDQKDQIFDYELMVYFCEWSDSEKLSWFETVNIAWEKLYKQELRNAVYTWPRLSDAKRHFSKSNCPAKLAWSDYITWDPIRQELLENALRRKSEKEWIEIEDYMWKHQHDNNADELWQYYMEIINRIERLFPKKRKEMKWLERWTLYNKYWDNKYNAQDLEQKISEMMIDDEVTSKKWIYEYLLSWNEKYLSLREFTDKQKAEAYEKCGWICAICGDHFEREEMHADHKVPWSKWWKTDIENCQMLCRRCNLEKSNKY